MTYPRSSLLHLAEAALSRMPLAPRQVIASACGVSVATLSRAIKDEQGEFFRAWQKRVALARAKALVIDRAQPRSVKEAAAELGFASQQSFTRWFRVETGLTPSAYRAQDDVVRHRPDMPRRGTSGTPLARGDRVRACWRSRPGPRGR